MSNSPDPASQTATRLEMAEEFLREAVYRSRGAQAGKALMSPGAKGNCGLGQDAAVVLDLSPRAEKLFSQLWPQPNSAEHITRIQELMTEWIEGQDQLDRDRNHFLKAFRGKHGARRSDYAPEQLAAYELGLEEVNAKVNVARADQARALLLATK